MFDQVIVRPRRKALKSVIVVGSALAHAAVVASLAVAAMWHVERVSLGPDRDDVSIGGPKPPAGAAALPPSGKLAEIPRKPPKLKVHDVVQPPLSTPEPTPATTPGGGGDPMATGGGGAGGGGNPDLPPCPQEPCADDGDPPAPEPPARRTVDVPPPAPPIVPPTVARGLRESGDEQVFPSRTTQLAMMQAGTTQVRGTFRLCVDERGAISSVQKLASTGYPDYDDALVDAMRGWHYRPYLLVRRDHPEEAPRPTAMCTVQTFVYRIRT